MDVLDHPDTQPLLHDAELKPEAVAACAGRLEEFAARYLPLFYRTEQRGHALTILRGKLTGLERKTTEPIAHHAGQERRPLQLFVGGGKWSDAAMVAEMRRHAKQELGTAQGIYILDGSAFPKKGADSCGVARQWCGRLGKKDNCQVGVFLAYATARGRVLLDGRLYLSESWASDSKRRAATYVPPEVVYQPKWRLALDLLDSAREDLPGTWVTGDDEFGRSTALRGELRWRQLAYVLDVPCNTLVRDPHERRAPTRPGGNKRRPLFERVDQWVARQPAGRWRAVHLRNGSKGPVTVTVLLATVQTKDEDGCVGPLERLVVIRSTEKKPQTWYTVSNARKATRVELARVHGGRHGMEELLGEGKGEVGLAHYEVRSWVGWHHHITLTLLALWFLQLERLRLGKKNTGHHGASGAANLHGATADAGSQPRTDRRRDQPRVAA
jgi:SRSO17 transposase